LGTLMKNKKIKTYKPKESNVVKLDTFLQKLNKDGYTFRK